MATTERPTATAGGGCGCRGHPLRLPHGLPVAAAGHLAAAAGRPWRMATVAPGLFFDHFFGVLKAFSDVLGPDSEPEDSCLRLVRLFCL